MGQCYSVYITARDIKPALLYQMTIAWSKYTKNKINETDLTSALESILGIGVEFRSNQNCKYISAAFDASYGWHTEMIRWFNYVSPAFTSDVYMSIYPDEGETKTWVDKDGLIVTKELSWSEMCDDDEYLKKWAEKIFKAVPELNIDQQGMIKEELGRSANIDELGEHYSGAFTDEQLTKIYKIVPDKVEGVN